LVTFDGPARAIRCASAIVEGAPGLGIEARAGLHAGECEMTAGGELGGVALQLVERVYYRAGASDVVVSSTVKDLVAGSGIAFNEVDVRLLTGMESGLRLHSVIHGARPAHGGAAALTEIESTRPPGALSPREREVTILVARGLSNRQTADELSISPATVERHVANILVKLGFHTRAQIAAWAVAHDLLRAEPG
jgi:DNA-binding NarL/FixJ family response regulator